MKKILASVSAIAMTLAMTLPASAYYNGHGNPGTTAANTTAVVVSGNNNATVNNTLNTAAATGGNTIAATGAQNNQHHDRGNNQAAAAIYGSAITTGNGTATGAVGNYANVIVTHVTNN